MSLLLARNGHGAMSDLSLLSGVKRKLDFWVVRSVDGPRTDIPRQHNMPIVEKVEIDASCRRDYACSLEDLMTKSASVKIELQRGNLTGKYMDIIVNFFEVPPGATVARHIHPG